MIDSKKSPGRVSALALATAAAFVFSAAPLTTANAADEAKVKCVGVNACKGQSKCSTAERSCAETNACKGKGWVEMTKEQCDAAKAANAAKQKA